MLELVLQLVFLMSFILEYRVGIILGFGVGTEVGNVVDVTVWPLVGLALMGAVVGFFARVLLAHMRKNETTET